MSSSEPAESKVTSTLQKRVYQLLQTHIRDLRAPTPDEVQRMVYELELYRSELEDENHELRDFTVCAHRLFRRPRVGPVARLLCWPGRTR
jgi:hypothetical protein